MDGLGAHGALVHFAIDGQTGGHYQVNRDPEDDQRGTLRVFSKDNALLLERDVALSFGAKFGPDVQDVADWNMIAMEALDKEADPNAT